MVKHYKCVQTHVCSLAFGLINAIQCDIGHHTMQIVCVLIVLVILVNYKNYSTILGSTTFKKLFASIWFKLKRLQTIFV